MTRRYAVVLVPVIPAAHVAVVVLRVVRETDELQGRIVLESLAGAFALGSLLTFGYGFLQIAGAPDVSWLFVLPVYCACWLVTAAVARRRWRSASPRSSTCGSRTCSPRRRRTSGAESE